jgi:hypothetical protein
MNKISQIDSYQVEQLLKRIEQIEAKLGIKVGSGAQNQVRKHKIFVLCQRFLHALSIRACRRSVLV